MTAETGRKSILDLKVVPKSDSQQNRIPRQIAKEKPQHKPVSKPTAPPCMASRQWRDAIRAENYKTVAGRDFESMCDNYPDIKDWPKDWQYNV